MNAKRLYDRTPLKVTLHDDAPAHTPGPWTYMASPVTNDKKMTPLGYTIYQKAEDSCRSVCNIDWSSGVDGEDEANAAIIAAAPDMLAVTIWAEAAFSHLARLGSTSKKDREEFQKRYEFARATRLKAEDR